MENGTEKETPKLARFSLAWARPEIYSSEAVFSSYFSALFCGKLVLLIRGLGRSVGGAIAITNRKQSEKKAFYFDESSAIFAIDVGSKIANCERTFRFNRIFDFFN